VKFLRKITTWENNSVIRVLLITFYLLKIKSNERKK